MIKIGSDLKFIPWIFAGLAVAFPLMLFLPLSLPFILGAGLVYFGIKQLLKYTNLNKWKKTNGALIKTEVGVLEEIDQYTTHKYYVPLAYFTYSWNNVELKSNQYAFDNKSIRSLDSKEVEKTIELLNSTDSLEVYVNPNNSSEAVLNTTVSKKRYSHAHALIVSGVLVTILGIVLLIRS